MLKRLSDSFRSSKQQSRRRQFPKLRFEPLEDRRLLATFTVTNTSDAAVTMAGDLPGSLRQAIFDANANPGEDSIEFDASVFTGGNASLIGLTAGELEITDTLTIADADSVQNEVTIDAQGNSRVLNFTASAGDLNLEGLTITGGLTVGDNINFPDSTFSGGGIRFLSDGTLSLLNSTVSENSTMGESARGGGIFSASGSVVLTDSTVIGNTATFFGGGIDSSGSITLTNSDVSDNGSGSIGGGIRGGLVTLVDSSVSDNTSVSGGGGISGGPVTLTDSTVSGNSTSGNNADGGGIDGGSITLTNSTVSGNSTSGDDAEGGGLRSFGPITLINSTLSGNSTSGVNAGGGGIRQTGATLTIINSLVTQNSTSGYDADGGAIRLFRVENTTITDSTISDNFTTGDRSSGGAIQFGGDSIFGSDEVSISGSTIRGNSTAGENANGGAIVSLSVSITLDNSQVTENSTLGYSSTGGGIHLVNGNVTLTNSTLSGNSTTGDDSGGGGIRSSLAPITIINSTVSANTASGNLSNGGAIDLLSGGSVTINNSTVTENMAQGTGGGLSTNSSPIFITNSIVAGNTASTSASDVQNTAYASTFTNSLIGSNDGTTLAAAPIGSPDANGNLIGTPASPIDPLLAPLAFNGGPTQTHALLPGSPAIDTGSTTLTADQRGVPRLIDGDGDGTATADIGAVEQNASSPIATTIVRDEGGVLARPDLLSTFAVSFDTDVSVSAEDLVIRNDTLGGEVVDSSAVTVEYDITTHTATWDFGDLILDPAFYSFELSSNIVSVADNLSIDGDLDGNPGGALVESVYVALPGDTNLDGQVDVLNDAFALVANLGTTGGAAWAQGDFNGDGSVNVLGDAFILVSRLGQSVVVGQPTEQPLTLVVTNLLDGPVSAQGDLPGSLRQAIFDANANPGDDTIEFDASVFTGGNASLIGLTAGELEITDTLTIADAVQNEVTIDAQGNSRVLNFTASTSDLNLGGLTITGGLTIGDNIAFPDSTFSGGGIRFESDGTLSLLNSTVSENSTMGERASGGGIFSVSGSVVLTNSAVSGNSTSGSGGGIAGESGAITLNNSTVTGNTSTRSGGGVSSSSGSITVNHSIFSENSTSGANADGGGIFGSSGVVITVTDSALSGNSLSGFGSEGGGIRATGPVTVTNSTISGNRTTGEQGDGGGIRITSGPLTLISSSLIGNSTHGYGASGGGIRGFASDISIINSTVSDNYTTGDRAGGGGIQSAGALLSGNSFAGSVTITGSTISGNSTSGDNADGGGIYKSNNQTGLTITNSTVSDNVTTGARSNGGGINLVFSGPLTLVGSTVSGNSTSGAYSEGGGISANGTSVTLTDSTVTGNSTAFSNSEGGGIYVRNGSITVANSIVAGNTANASGTDLFLNTDDQTFTNSLIGDNGSTLLLDAPVGSPDADGNLVGTPTSPIDPLLAPLAFNGGPTQTHALLPGSPAIDAGNSSAAFDQRGQARVVDLAGAANTAGGNGADIGAFERQITEPLGTPPVVSSIVRDEGGVFARPDLLSTFTVSFDADVSVSADDLVIRNDTLGGEVVDSSTVTLQYDATTHIATWDFGSLILDPAFYSFELSSNIVSVADNLSIDGDLDGNPGGALVESVYVALPGDTNLDGQVDVLNDAFALVANLGTTDGAVWAQGDFNGDGSVNVLGDAFILVSRLGQSVVPTTPPIPTLFLAKSDPTVAQAISTPFTNVAPLESFATEKDEERQSNERSTPTEQLALAGSEELDATFASGSLFDGDLLLG